MAGVETIHVKTDTADYTLKGHACELSAFAFVPVKRDVPSERTVFNSVGKVSNGKSRNAIENVCCPWIRVLKCLIK